ncbi:MAG: HEAT repeat domain-containing protein [Saprospiraceae bacterium]|nr:HEAT repeat domain-containing protein [Pyrinomonadaceae bacterium]
MSACIAVQSFAQDTAPPNFTQQQIDWLPVEIYLQNQLRTGNVEAKREALFQIRNLRCGKASLLAIPALTDKSEIVRATAASSVIFLPADEAVGLLLPLLNDKAEFVRREAAYALGKAGSNTATGTLLLILQKDKILEVRNASAAALGEIGDVGAVPALTAILNNRPADGDEFLRRSAARSIGQIAQMIQSGKSKVLTPQNFLPDKFREIETRKYPDLTGQFPAFGPATAELIRVLQSSSEAADTRREAAFALGAIGDPSAISALASNLSGTDPYLSEIAREALLKFGKTK